jgi:hypothetical protein
MMTKDREARWQGTSPSARSVTITCNRQVWGAGVGIASAAAQATRCPSNHLGCFTAVPTVEGGYLDGQAPVNLQSISRPQGPCQPSAVAWRTEQCASISELPVRAICGLRSVWSSAMASTFGNSLMRQWRQEPNIATTPTVPHPRPIQLHDLHEHNLTTTVHWSFSAK